MRWDNAPYHKNIRTYPHHKHINDKVEESFETTCERILTVISGFLRKRN
ncbi:toxin-antitoxin system TumE family protein [Thermovibrio sp.]